MTWITQLLGSCLGHEEPRNLSITEAVNEESKQPEGTIRNPSSGQSHRLQPIRNRQSTRAPINTRLQNIYNTSRFFITFSTRMEKFQIEDKVRLQQISDVVTQIKDDVFSCRDTLILEGETQELKKKAFTALCSVATLDDISLLTKEISEVRALAQSELNSSFVSKLNSLSDREWNLLSTHPSLLKAAIQLNDADHVTVVFSHIIQNCFQQLVIGMSEEQKAELKALKEPTCLDRQAWGKIINAS
jgi:hypothetical protein